MKEEFVSYEQSRKLKALGFDWECDRIYVRDINDKDKWEFADWEVESANWNKRHHPQMAISAPPTWMAQKWLREVKGIEVFVIPYHIQDTKGYKWIMETDDVLFPSKRAAALYVNHESALSQGISQALTLLTEPHAD